MENGTQKSWLWVLGAFGLVLGHCSKTRPLCPLFKCKMVPILSSKIIGFHMPFCSDFQWVGFGMVRTIAINIGMTNHWKSELQNIQYSNVLYSCPPLYLNNKNITISNVLVILFLIGIKKMAPILSNTIKKLNFFVQISDSCSES